ncbi:MAG: ATPase domain-containing protein [Candidatus Bathyarchaeia archaeon]
MRTHADACRQTETYMRKPALLAPRLSSSQGLYRFKTGIPELDKALNGGIPAKLTVAVMNDPENDVSTFCQQFIWEGLKSGDVCVYFCYDHHPQTIRENMALFGWDTKPYEDRMDFILVDCYSARTGERGKEKHWLERPFEPQRLVEMFRTLEREVSILKPNRPARVVLDSFSALIEVLNYLEIHRVVLKLQGLCKKGNYVGIGVMHKGIHGQMNEFIAKHTSEGVIELYSRVERKKLRQFMRVSKMSLTRFDSTEIPYIITEQGLTVTGKPEPALD